MITYNHVRYIDEAIESVIRQKTSFPIELVVGDDCSTDETRAKIAAWVQRYPEIIRPLMHSRNLGMNANGDAVLKSCRGEFIACLEGDDYWTDLRKLQIQVEYLEKHPETVACFHCMEARSGVTGEALYTFPQETDRRDARDASDVLRNHYIPSNSRMWRRAVVPALDPRLHRIDMGDWAIDVMLSVRGPIGYIDRAMGVYRVHGGGSWSGASDLQRRRLLRDCAKFNFSYVPAKFKADAHRAVVDAQVGYLQSLSRSSRRKACLEMPEYLYWILRLPLREAIKYVGLLTSMWRR